MTANPERTLADLKPGQDGIVKGIAGDISLKRRLAALGLVNGTKVSLGYIAPLGDPRTYEILDYILSLRNREASQILLHRAPEPSGAPDREVTEP